MGGGGGGGGGDEMGLPNGDESFMNCSSSGMSTNPFLASGWDPAVSLSQHENFGTSSIVSQSEFTNSLYPGVMANQGISSSSHHDHYTSDSTFVELVPKFPCFGSGNFSDMIGAFGLTECGQIANTGCPPSYILTKEGKNERNMAIDTQSQEDQRLMHEASLGASPTGKRRKRSTESNTHFDPTKDPYKENSDKAKKQDDKKPRTEQAAGSNVQDEEATKQSKDNSNSGGAPKENYIHVRARRGQATNSHSLAERVRREKISERMRLLQDLVPGCNKITGKAVMLDEIINYVQSLQQQVEFLSMKLATVNPELNVDLERLLSKDILHPRVGNPSIMGLSSGMSSYPFSLGIFQPSTLVLPNVNPQLPSVPQAVLDNELQSLMQMGFESNSAIDTLGPNGPLKLEL